MTVVEPRRREWWVLLAIAVAGALVAGTLGLVLRHPGRRVTGPPAAPVAVDSTVESGHPSASAAGSATVPPTTIPPVTTRPAAGQPAPVTTTSTGAGTGPVGGAGPTTTATPPPPPPQMVTVPDVMYYAEAPAVDAIRSAGLTPQVDYQQTQNQCYVIWESPPGNTQAVVGQTVYITVATNTGPCEVT